MANSSIKRRIRSKQPGKGKPRTTAAGDAKFGKRTASPQLVSPGAGRAGASEAADPGRVDTRETGSKQSRVIAMLRAAQGATIPVMMQATGWQQHSVRGFLAGVVRKKLQLKLESRVVEGVRVYRLSDDAAALASSSRAKRRAA